MKSSRLWLLSLLFLSPPALSAQQSVEIDGVIYTRGDVPKYCTPAPASNCSGDIVIHRLVEFPDDGSGYTQCGVYQIPDNTFKGCSNITSITIEECPDDYPYTRQMGVYDKSFADCQSLVSVDFPSDMKYLYTNSFESLGKLETIVCRAVQPPSLNSMGSIPAIKATIYVPDVDSYAANSGWAPWKTLLRPISEYSGPVRPDPDPEPTPARVTLRVDGGRIVLPPMEADAEISFVADYGYDIHVDDGNGPENKGASHTISIPAEGGEIEILPTFRANGLSSAASVTASVPGIRVVNGSIEITNAGDSQIVITSPDGAEIYCGRATKHVLTPGVYVVTVGQYGFKVAI